MGSDFGGERKNSETTAVRGAINGEKKVVTCLERKRSSTQALGMEGEPCRRWPEWKESQKQGKNGDAGLGEDCRTSLERCWKWPESEPRAVTRRRVGDSPEEKGGAWGRVRCRLPVGFPLACRSASGVLEYVVIARKIGRRKISPEKVVGVVEIRRR